MSAGNIGAGKSTPEGGGQMLELNETEGIKKKDYSRGVAPSANVMLSRRAS